MTGETGMKTAELQHKIIEDLTRLATPAADRTRDLVTTAVRDGDGDAIQREGRLWSGPLALLLLELADRVGATRSAPQAASYAWCFSHGRMHAFGSGSTPWCTATWMRVHGDTPEAALAAKQERWGEARFVHDLPPSQQMEVYQKAGRL